MSKSSTQSKLLCVRAWRKSLPNLKLVNPAVVLDALPQMKNGGPLTPQPVRA